MNHQFKFIRTSFIIILLFLNSKIWAQENQFGLIFPDYKQYEKCISCQDFFENKPSEVGYGTYKEDSNKVYFVMTDYEWFLKLFNNNSQGISVDIVPRSLFECGTTYKKDYMNGAHDLLLPPIYKKEILNRITVDDQNTVFLYLGDIPEKHINDEIEFNILFINKKFICRYNTFYDLASFESNLLEIPLILSPNDKLKFNTIANDTILNKELQFTIPFQKDKHEYNIEDILPIYDSLKLSEYIIREMNIKAYASVEGSKQHNIFLQTKRAETISQALSSLQQKDSCSIKIQANENWVEFFNDIENTQFEGWKNLPQKEIKKKIKESSQQASLENILNSHRKAIITLNLERRINQSKLDSFNLSTLIDSLLKNNETELLLELQKKHPSVAIYIDKQEKDFNVPTIFIKSINPNDSISRSNGLKFLKELYIQNKSDFILYNIATLELINWNIKHSESPDQELIDHVKTIFNSKEISNHDKLRFQLNYFMTQNKYYLSQRDYTLHEKNIKSFFLFVKKEQSQLNEFESLNLAKYFANGGKEEYAEQLLRPFVQNINVSENTLFYYLNLTIIDNKIVRRSDYRKIMLNATALNKDRFCHLFDTYGSGGITFQLLENKYLKNNYCEICSE